MQRNCITCLWNTKERRRLLYEEMILLKVLHKIHGQKYSLEFSVQIHSHIREKSHDLLTPTFTTTGPVEIAAAEIVLINTFKEYFGFIFKTCCGIPENSYEREP